jgi:hypothetical protein
MNQRKWQELEVSTATKLRRAIEKKDYAEALGRFEELREGEKKLRNALVDWIDTLLIYISEQMGEEGVNQALRAVFDRTLKPFIGREFGQISPEDRMKNRAYIWTRLHNVDITIEEDEEKFVIKWPCDTGGRVATKDSFGKTSRPYPWSNSETGMAYYCTHCTIAYEVRFVEELGYHNFIVIPPLKADEQCTQIIYKDKEKVPEQYYEMIGMRKRK